MRTEKSDLQLAILHAAVAMDGGGARITPAASTLSSGEAAITAERILLLRRHTKASFLRSPRLHSLVTVSIALDQSRPGPE